MKKSVAFLCVVFVLTLSTCDNKCDSKKFLEQVNLVRLVEEPVARELVVNAGIESKDQDAYFQNVDLNRVPISSKSSSIIIVDDTLGFSGTPDDLEVEPSEAGANVYISLNVQPGGYYCQSLEDGKMTCERGLIGIHLNKRGLTTLDTFPSASHFASAVSQSSIHVLKNNPPPTGIQSVKQYSTEGKTIYVCNENGKLVISEKPEL